MPVSHEEILAVVLGALAAVNASRPTAEQFPVDSDTPLLGHRAVLNSLELVTFILEVETRLVEQLDLHLPLTDDRAFSQVRSPFRRPTSLVEYILATVVTPATETTSDTR